jgi:hypothetical protein
MIRRMMMTAIMALIITEGRMALRFNDEDCTWVEDVVWKLVGDDPADIKDEGDVGVDSRGDNSQQMFEGHIHTK